MKLLLIFHVAGATVGLVSGTVSMFARKAGLLHRRAGNVFVVSMLAMCAAAIVIATFHAEPINVVAGTLTAYLVATARITARPFADPRRRLERALIVITLVAGSGAVLLGLQDDGGVRAPLFMFGLVGVSGSIGDFKTLRAGTLTGTVRLTRHLWRM